jgi:hypothetical protein
MNNLIAIYDDKDIRMGNYFAASHQDLNDKLSSSPHINLQSLNTEQCLTNPIEHHISRFEGKPFVFIAYSHGNDDSIYIGDNKYIHSQNAYFFGETLFYSCCCLTAKKLGSKLREQGCRIFIGYNTKITSVADETDPYFQQCENTFIHNFLTTDDTIQESLSYMYKKYSEMRLYLLDNYNAFTASTLENNLDAFEIMCDSRDNKLKKSAFFGI